MCVSLRRFWLMLAGACVWSAVVWLGTQDIPLGAVARPFAPPQPDPVWFETWFAEHLPLFNTLARVVLAGIPWAALALICGSWLVSLLMRPRVFAGTLAACLLLSFPPPIAASSPGLDQSWQWFLNFTAGKCVFGREVIFTYGPLGYLLMPQLGLANALAALVANGFFLLFWGFCLWSLYRLSDGGRRGACLLLLTMFIPQGNMEWRWVALACLAPGVLLVRRLVADEPDWRDIVLAVGAGLVLALSSLMKFSSLVTIAGTQLFLFGAVAVCSRRQRLAPGVLWAVTFAVGFGLLACVSFASWEAVWTWARGSLRIADGYNKFFIAEKSALQLALTPVCLAAAALLFLFRNRGWRKILILGGALSPLFFCAMKYAWTRQGPTAFYYLLSVATALVVALSPSMIRRAGTVVVVLLSVTWGLVLPRVLVGTATFDFTCGINPQGLVDTLRLAHSADSAREATARVARATALPDAWLAQIGKGRVQFLPYDFTPVMGAHDFAFCPIPVLQLYSAYLPELDALCAAVYAQKVPPDYIVVTADPMWCGYLLNHPQTWQAVLQRYAFADRRESRILLRRRANPPPNGLPARRDACVVRAGEWLDCTSWPREVQLSIRWAPTVLGRLSTTFFRNTMTYLSLKYADGSVFRIPLNPSTTAHPFPLTAIPRSADEMEMLFRNGVLPHAPIALRFEATTPALYAKEIAVTIQESGN